MDMLRLLFDIFAFFLSVGVVSAILFICKYLRRRGVSRDILREMTHISAGIWPLFWFLFSSKTIGVLVPLTMTIFLALAPSSVRRTYSNGEEKHIGLVLYSLMFTIATYLYWMDPIGAAAIFSLAFADGSAGLIGKRLGRHRFAIPWGREKSIEGFLTFFFVCALSIVLAYMIFSRELIPIYKIVLAALVGACIEFFAPPHTDNVLIPLGIILILAILT